MFPLTSENRERLLYDGVHNVPGLPFYPLDSPGMPLPGPDFVAHAAELGDNSVIDGKGKHAVLSQVGPYLNLLYFQALYDQNFAMPIAFANRRAPCMFQCGHLDGVSHADGPRPARVMVIGKQPGREEHDQKRNLVGSTSQHLWNACQEVGIPASEISDWYLTNLVRFSNPDPNVSKISNAWVQDCAVLLQQELRIVRPQFILCLGADASKALIGLGVDAMRGRVEQLVYPIHKRDEKPEYGVAQVMTVVHPAQVHRTPELSFDLKSTMSAFWGLIRGVAVGGVERDIDHRVVDNETDLAAIVDAINADPDPASRIVAVDAEWHGQKPWEPGSYLRTVQFSHKPKFACCVVLRAPGGRSAFYPNEAAAANQLRRLFFRPDVRLGGHFFRSDIPWIDAKLGIDLSPLYAPATTPELTATSGGWDTSLMEHAVNETGRLGLEILRSKYTTAPPYEVKLTQWKKRFCTERGIEESELDGFGEWDGQDFYDYANYDADVTRRIVDAIEPVLDKDRFGNSSRRAYWVNHCASRAVLEMEQTGLVIDERRVNHLSEQYVLVRNTLIEHIRHLLNWQSFNPNSDVQCRAALFGDRYTREPAPAGWPDVRPTADQTLQEARLAVARSMKDAATASGVPSVVTRPLDDRRRAWVYILPGDAVCQNLTPLLTTGTRAVSWEKVVAKGEESSHSPSTKGQVLAILGATNRVAAVLRDIRFLSKALQTVLRRPEIDATTGEYEQDEDGEYVYDKGLLAYKCGDGKVHTRLLQTMDTGRGSSSKPPLQNVSSRREADFSRIFGYLDAEGRHKGSYKDLFPVPRYEYPQRSVFVAPPGHVLMEADYSGAELSGIMWMSQDPVGLEDVRRNNLPDNHPDKIDMHAATAVRAFHLKCEATKKGLKSVDREALRVGGKAVNFSTPYGISAEAVALKCQEEGAQVSVAEAQAMLDAYFSRYELTANFLNDCRARTHTPCWMTGAFGRHRRFYWSDDRQIVGEQERQACNFPIQNLVADAVWTALYNMWRYREDTGIDAFKFLLQIHDAVMLLVPFEHVPLVYHTVFPKCMVNDVDVWPCDLNGKRFNLKEPYHLAVGRDIAFRWGEDVDPRVMELLDENTAASNAAAIELLKELEPTNMVDF